MISFFQKYRRSSFLRSVLSLSSATVLSQLIVVAATPFLSRMYSPSEFGVLAAFTGIAVTVIVVSSFRYDLAIPVQRNDASANRLIVASLIINTIIAFVTVPIIAIFGTSLAAHMNVPLIFPYIWLVPIFVVFSGAYRIYVAAAIRKKNYKLVSRTRISQAVATVCFQICGGVARLGSFGLIGGFVLGGGVGLFLLVKKIGSPFAIARVGCNVRLTVRLLKENSRFPKLDMPAAAVDTLGAQLPSLLLAVLFNPAIAGFYAVTYRLLAAPATLIGQAIGQVLLGSARNLCDTGQITLHLRKVILSLSGLALIPMILGYLFAGPLLVWVLGSDWVEAGVYAKWIALGLATQLIYSPISTLLLATEGQHVNLTIHVILLVLKVLALLFGYQIGSPLVSVIGVSLANALGYLLAVVWLYRHVMSYSSMRGRK